MKVQVQSGGLEISRLVKLKLFLERVKSCRQPSGVVSVPCKAPGLNEM